MSGIPLPALSIKPPEDPLTGYAKALSIRGAQQQLQAGQQENQQRQMDLDSQRALMKAYHDSNGDMDKTVELAAQYGAKPQAIMQVKTAILDQKQKLATLSTDQLNNLQKQNEMVGQTAGAALQLPPEQRKAFLIQKALPQLVQNGVMKPEDAQQQIQQISGADDAGLESFLKTHQLSAMSTDKQLSEARAAQAAADTHNAAVAQLPGQQAGSDEKVRANAASQLATAKDQADYEARRGQLPYAVAKAFPDQFDRDAVLKAGMTPHEQVTIPTDKLEMNDWLAKNPGKGPSDFLKAKALLVPQFKLNIENGGPAKNPDGTTDVAATAKKFGMSAAAFDQTSEKYFQTGQLPPAGRGLMGPAFQRAVMNRTAELHPEGDLAANAGAFAANKESLKKLQTTFDQVSAFESTATKNIDLLQQTAQKIPDLGSRWANTPVRAITGKMIGTDNMASFKTALNTAQTESAKVLNSANASGILSDSARHELQDIIDGKMSYSAMVASLNTLKQDMANRHQSYQEQINDIQGRMKGKGAAKAKQSGSGFSWNDHPVVK